MHKPYRFPTRVGFGLGIFAVATGLAAAGEKVPTASPLREFVPSRKASKLLIHNEIPVYPPIAKMNYIQGKVVVQTYVDDSGEVKEVHVVKGHPFLAVAALKAIKNWVYKPAKLRHGPEKFLTYVDVKFALRYRKLGQLPERPEADLNDRVRPPKLKDKLPDHSSQPTVRVKILVGADGRAIDSVSLEDRMRDLEEARRVIANWTFNPAQWGAIPVPWYLEVDVPVGAGPTAQSTPVPPEPPTGMGSSQ